ncbi:hypothetical protein ACIP98_37190 [Streptomyces sp. NPDC088354]|uniref:hypothetical protein n=1 Tax=Streptomyces sp. NPDC088354 TaxID=3365856 RepID=UPI00382FB09B
MLAGLFWDLSPWVRVCALESLGHARRVVRSSCRQPQTVLATRAIMLVAGMAGRGVGMAGVRVTVCLPAEAADDIQGALARAVAPFYSDTDDNPVERGMWDERRIQGGSDGLGFAVAPGYWDDPRLIHDNPGRDGGLRPSIPGVCAGGPRALLDFSQPHLASERAAAASWDLWHSLVTLPAGRFPGEFRGALAERSAGIFG